MFGPYPIDVLVVSVVLTTIIVGVIEIYKAALGK